MKQKLKEKLITFKIFLNFFTKVWDFSEILLKIVFKKFWLLHLNYINFINKHKDTIIDFLPNILLKKLKQTRKINVKLKPNYKLILKMNFLIKLFMLKRNEFFKIKKIKKDPNIFYKTKFYFDKIKVKFSKFEKNNLKPEFIIQPFFFKKKRVSFSILRKNKFYYKSQNVRIRQVCYNVVFLCLSILTLILIISSGKFYFFEKSFFDMNYFFLILYLLIPFFFNKLKNFLFK